MIYFLLDDLSVKKGYFYGKINIFKLGGGGKIRTFEDRSQRVYSPPHLTALEPLLWGSVPLFNKASNNKRFIYFIYANATRDLIGKY